MDFSERALALKRLKEKLGDIMNFLLKLISRKQRKNEAMVFRQIILK